MGYKYTWKDFKDGKIIVQNTGAFTLANNKLTKLCRISGVEHAGGTGLYYYVYNKYNWLCDDLLSELKKYDKVPNLAVVASLDEIDLNYKESMIEFKENEVYHAETEEEAKLLLVEANKQGYKWVSGNLFISKNRWEVNKENTCYYITGGSYSYKEFYKKHYPGLKIVKVRDLFNLKQVEASEIKIEEDVYYAARTEEEAKWIINLMHNNGYKWFISASSVTHWGNNINGVIHYNINNKEIFYSTKGKRDYKIVKVKDLINLQTNNNKNEVSRKITESGSTRPKGIRVNRRKIKLASSSRLVGSEVSNSRRRIKVRSIKIETARLQFD